MEDIVWFKDLNKENIAIAGGKGANLGEMYNAKFPIPSGFAISAKAFKEFLTATGLKSKIMKILKSTDVDNTEQLTENSEKVKRLILEEKIPSTLVKDIMEAYDNLNVDQEILHKANKNILEMVKSGRDLPFVAVRSSATAEDLPSISEEEHVFLKLNNKAFFGTMKELSKIYRPEDNIEIPSMNNNFEIEWEKAEIYQHLANEKTLFKITTSTGKQVTITPNHSLIILDENILQPKITSISELKGNEKIPVIKKIPLLENIDEINVLDYINKENVVEYNNKIMIKNNCSNWKIQQGLSKNIKITENFAYFFGIYAAEGSTYKENGISITNSNSEVIEKTKNFFDEIEINYSNKLNKHSLRVCCKALTRFLNENCGKPDKNIIGKGKICRSKKVPSFIFSCSQKIIGDYLRGCFDGDGTITKGCIGYTSTSKDLIAGISTLLQLLNIEYYIKEKNKAFDINIASKSIKEFKKSVGFSEIKKLNRLNTLIKEYESKNKHYEFKNSISISKNIAKEIRKIIENNLHKQKIIDPFCPLCTNKINKSSYHKELIRYYCPDCKKIFYEKDIIKKEVKKYVNYDEKGRFTKNTTPWNKAINTYPAYGINNFKQILSNNGCIELIKSLSEDFIWDRIKKIEEVPYNSWVYDFSILNNENFSAGLGGIITHNTASFAGQQETFLNIKGNENLIKAVKKCWASLYTPRAIFYRIKNHFPHEKVLISVIVQKMVNSTKSGVIFTANPSTNNRNEIVIDASFGLGETVVGGLVTADSYILDKNTLKLKFKKIGSKKIKIIRNLETGENITKKTTIEEQKSQVLTDYEINTLGELAKKIELHYQKPQDIEFAIDQEKIYIVQSRPITTLKEKTEQTNLKGEVLTQGISASPGIGIGEVKIVTEKNIFEFKQGQILVTEMTNPTMVPIMQKAAAIVTDEGSQTSHAAIVSREMGVPCIVGTETATKVLHNGLIVTVDAVQGKVFKGEVKEAKAMEEKLEILDTGEGITTKTKVYMNLGEPHLIDKYKKLNFDGIGLMRVEFIIAGEIGEHPLSLIKKGQQDFYINKLALGIEKVAKAIKPKPVIVRFSDFKTNEYHELKGGAEFEKKEENPMIGFRGVSRYVSKEFKEAFRLECKAIKKVRETCKNVHIMLPFVRNIDEVKKCIEILKEEGLERNADFKIWLMAEVPSMAIIPEDFASLEDVSACSIGSNDLTMLVLGVDRDSELLAKEGYFDERNKAVLTAIKRIIGGFHKHNKTVSICGQAPSVYKEITEFLVKEKIDSISVNPDVVGKTRRIIADVEKSLE